MKLVPRHGGWEIPLTPTYRLSGAGVDSYTWHMMGVYIHEGPKRRATYRLLRSYHEWLHRRPPERGAS